MLEVSLWNLAVLGLQQPLGTRQEEQTVSRDQDCFKSRASMIQIRKMLLATHFLFFHFTGLPPLLKIGRSRNNLNIKMFIVMMSPASNIDPLLQY